MGIIARDISKGFSDPVVNVLKGISLTIEDGEFVSIVGRSGSGKTTLLYILSTLDEPTGGSLEIDGHVSGEMGEENIHAFRNRNIGYVFQFHYLLPELNVLENVLLPARKFNEHGYRLDFAIELLGIFGLTEKRDRFPRQLSGGEQQRVAIARSLIMQPKYIFADEPTGNLDTVNSRVVMDNLTRINSERGTTIILVTHDPDYAALAKRQITLIDGRVI